jgi:antitoxin HigA-1
MVKPRGRGRQLPPSKPSEFLRELMKDYDITQDSLAALLGTTRYSVNQLVNDKRGITAEMALRLAKAFSNTPEFWMNLQQNIDVDRARRRLGRLLKSIKPLRKPVTLKDFFFEIRQEPNGSEN